jgi:Fe2+ transport system protein FeoA
MKSLIDMKVGEKRRLVDSPDSQRFQDLGLLKGTKVVCTKNDSIWSMVALKFRGTEIAIRHDDARNIFVV